VLFRSILKQKLKLKDIGTSLKDFKEVKKKEKTILY
jgi:hypothetical protein